METCFVIQPFDKDKYDKRYTDIFNPAIKKAGLTPYRIDKDLSVRIPIDDIEKGILESTLCFAEISTDNPNVWYELGYAFALNKDVVMVCSDERLAGKFPFDIQHRQILSYKTTSKSDFEILEDSITKKILAYLQKNKTVKTLQSTPVVEIEGLSSHEIAFLILLMENQLTSEDSMSMYVLRSEMNKAGYTDIATSVASRLLSKKSFIETFTAVDNYNNDNPYPACRMTPAGEEWILANQVQLVFRKDPIQESQASVDDLPF